jgi:quercetin dioxygenase-like cupin family protein
VKVLSTLSAAREAVSAQPTRPATALLHDSPDARVVVFRIEPGQEVAPHTSTSTVLLAVLAGKGTVSGASGESPVVAGDLVSYDTGEVHGMRAGDETLVLMATIAPRPGAC